MAGLRRSTTMSINNDVKRCTHRNTVTCVTKRCGLVDGTSVVEAWLSVSDVDAERHSIGGDEPVGDIRWHR